MPAPTLIEPPVFRQPLEPGDDLGRLDRKRNTPKSQAISQTVIKKVLRRKVVKLHRADGFIFRRRLLARSLRWFGLKWPELMPAEGK